MHEPKLIDQYILKFPTPIQEKLNEIRKIIQASASGAEETINYQMPTFKLHGNLVHFAAHKNHIGFYPAPSAIVKFKEELSVFVSSKGAVQFPITKPLPQKLIGQMVRFRVQENLEKAKQKSAKKCANGHTYFKTSDCPVCPVCEKENKSKQGPWEKLAAPAQRALKNAGIHRPEDLIKYTEKQLLELHGMGPSSIPKLKVLLRAKKLSFKK